MFLFDASLYYHPLKSVLCGFLFYVVVVECVSIGYSRIPAPLRVGHSYLFLTRYWPEASGKGGGGLLFWKYMLAY